MTTDNMNSFATLQVLQAQAATRLDEAKKEYRRLIEEANEAFTQENYGLPHCLDQAPSNSRHMTGKHAFLGYVAEGGHAIYVGRGNNRSDAHYYRSPEGEVTYVGPKGKIPKVGKKWVAVKHASLKYSFSWS